MGIIYVSKKPTIYEVKSVARIGYINHTLVEDSNILEKKLRLIYNVDNKNNKVAENKAIVSNIKTVRNINNFIEISTQSYSKKLALEKNKEVVLFIQNEYKYKIDEFILKTKFNIENLKENITHIENVEKLEIEKNIEKIKQQAIPKIDEEINLIKNVQLKTIENKLNFYEKKLNDYENILIKVAKQKSSNDTQNMLMSMQMLNTQNLILEIQNKIQNLFIEKEKLKSITLKDLKIKKENLLNENIRQLETKLSIDIESRLKNLKKNIEFEELKLKNGNISNTEVIGEILVDFQPTNIKKVIIIFTLFLFGLILSIFLIFFINFLNNFKSNSN